MSVSGLVQLGLSTVVFLLAASAAKAWTITPTLWRMVLVLALMRPFKAVLIALQYKHRWHDCGGPARGHQPRPRGPIRP